MNDFRFALRQLRKSPGFTFVAILTLALGIGLNTTIFRLINDLFLRGLPFKEPSRVVHLDNSDKARDLEDVGISAPRYQLYRDGQTIFDGLAAENFFAFTLTGLGDPVQIFGGRLTSNYFDVLGVRPILGRNFLPEEEENADVALVTKNFWQERLGGDPNVIGRSITLDGTPHTIVGVLPNMPATWFGANSIAEIWTTKPFQIPGFSYEQMMRGAFFLRVVGRLKPGVTVQQARAALPSLEQSYRAQYPNKIDSALVTTLRALPEDVTRNFRAGFVTPRGLRYTFRRSEFRFVNCLQQCCQSIACSFQWTPARGRVANRAWGFAHERRPFVRCRKFAGECNCGSGRRARGLAFGAVGPGDGIQISSVGNRNRDQFVNSSSTIRDWIVGLDRSLDGNLSSASEFARRFG